MSRTEIDAAGIDPRIERRSRIWALVLVVLLLLVAVVGVVGVLVFVAEERARDRLAWQSRLSVVADARAEAVNSVLAQYRDTLRQAAVNPTVQIYATEMAQVGGDRAQVQDEAGKATYVRNYLEAEAIRAGFADGGTGIGANLPASGGGLAFLGPSGEVLVATSGMPEPDERVSTFVDQAAAGGDTFLDLHRNAADQVRYGFLEPVYRVQADADPDNRVGWILGLRGFGEDVTARLRQSGAVEETLEVMLVDRVDDRIRYLSPLRSGLSSLELELEADASLAVSRLWDGAVFAFANDYHGSTVLAAGQALVQAPWMLVAKIDAQEALADSRSRLSRMLIGGLLVIALLLIVIWAFWRHGTSRRAMIAAHKLTDLARRFEQQRRLLQTVTDNQPASIFIVDGNARLRFANGPFAERLGVAAEDLAGKDLPAAMGPAAAQAYAADMDRAVETGLVVSELHETEVPEVGRRAFDRALVPLDRRSGDPEDQVLVVETDVTDLIAARRRGERILKEVVEALVMVVDRRDPYSATHSKQVAKVAAATATEIGLEPEMVEAVKFAGSLLNLGKIGVPKDLLVKESLTDAERQRIRQSILESADLLTGIEFSGPVVESLKQAQERWDGSGIPAGLKGASILITARILAVANALVAMVNPRAHRAALPLDKAVEILLEEAGHAYDRAVVAALINWLDNRGGRQALEAGRHTSVTVQ